MPARRVLVTGGSGFVGQWMCLRLLAGGHTVFAGTIEKATGPRVLSPDQRAGIRWLNLDTGSDESVARGVDDASPEWVVHLAAYAFPPDAAAVPTMAFDVNALGVQRIIHRLGTSGAIGVRVLVIGSAEQYGLPTTGTAPIPETAPQAPLNVYAASKCAQELIALQTGRVAGVPVVCTRSFNHSGYGHGPQYLMPSLVARALAVKQGGGTLSLGNGTPVRDYLHVADVTAAYEALLERGVAGEPYNVCSGHGHTVRSIAEQVLARLGVDAGISEDPSLVRHVDVPHLVGDNAKLRSATGWRPRLTLDDMIDDLVNAKAR